MLGAFDEHAQLALENEVHLLLVFVRVDPQALPGLEHDQVHAERVHAEEAPQRLETLAAVAVERAEGHIGGGHRRAAQLSVLHCGQMWTFAFPSTSQPKVRALPSLTAGVAVRAPLQRSHTGSPVSSSIIRAR